MIKTDKKKEFLKAFRLAFPNTIPVLTGFLVLGMAYGVLMQTKGYGLIWSVAMSAVAFCGSMQFVAITLLTIAFNPLQAFTLSLMVNARHLFYGISMLEKYKGLGKTRAFLIYVLCDETFSISSSVSIPDGINRKYFYLSISLLNYIYWVLGTFLGAVAGRYIHFNTTGLDFVLTSLFVVLFLEQWKNPHNRLSAMIGIAGTSISLLLFGQNHLVIPAMIIILSALLIGRKKLCN
ncbi:MAG: AzlC family ABC transporter permease [Anaerovorax sp.]|nr:AzlC family ABC transporter permease [Anaerovorax sp.]